MPYVQAYLRCRHAIETSMPSALIPLNADSCHTCRHATGAQSMPIAAICAGMPQVQACHRNKQAHGVDASQVNADNCHTCRHATGAGMPEKQVHGVDPSQRRNCHT